VITVGQAVRLGIGAAVLLVATFAVLRAYGVCPPGGRGGAGHHDRHSRGARRRLRDRGAAAVRAFCDRRRRHRDRERDDGRDACRPGLLAGLRASRQEVEAWLSLGATPRQAGLDVARHAAGEALVPAIDQTRTTGLVSLPGAFVGALLGGASRFQAAGSRWWFW
jgi:hypothetical protein